MPGAAGAAPLGTEKVCDAVTGCPLASSAAATGTGITRKTIGPTIGSTTATPITTGIGRDRQTAIS